MSDGTPLPNRTEETPVSGRNYPEDDPEGRRWSEIWRAAIEELNANALVSDVAANRLDYDPKDGMVYVPTDGGNWYLGDGSGWRDLGPIGDIGDHIGDTTNPHSVTAAQADALPTSGGTVTGDTTFTNTVHDSVDTDELQHGDAQAVPQSIDANVTAGRPVIYVDGVGCRSVSFGDYATHDAALQALVDWATAEREAYELHIPSHDETGDHLTIENTVEMSPITGRAVAEVYVRAGRWEGDRGIQTTINDGSPLFRFDYPAHFSKFIGGRFRLGGNNASAIEWIDSFHFQCEPAWVENFTGSGIIVNTACFGFTIDNCRMRPDNRTGTCIELRNDHGTSSEAPGYGAVGPGFVSETLHGVSFQHCQDGRPMSLAGHYEGATGTAAVHLPTGARLTVSDEARFLAVRQDESGNPTPAILIEDSTSLNVNGATFGTIEGDGITSTGQYSYLYISPYTMFNSIDGHTINLPDGAGIMGVIPEPSNINGTVNYPDPNTTGWGQLRTASGWELLDTGTVTVPAGGEAAITAWQGNGNFPEEVSFKVEHWIESAPTGDVRYRETEGYDNGNNRRWIGFEETMGTADVQVSYEFWRKRGRPFFGQ